MTDLEQEQREEEGISWISIPLAAQRLGVKPPAVWYYINSRKIPTKKFDFDKKRYIPFDQFQEILKDKEASRKGLREDKA